MAAWPRGLGAALTRLVCWGIDALRRIAVDALTDDGSVLSARTLLRPWTEGRMSRTAKAPRQQPGFMVREPRR